MLELSDLDMYKNKFFSIYSNNVSDEFLNGLIYQNLFMDYIDKINDMLKNENFKTKLEDYINNDLKLRDNELLKLYESKNESIVNLITKERFIKLAENSKSALTSVAKYTNKYFDDISDNILKNLFNDEEIYVIRAVSDEKFGEIFVQLRMECKENEICKMREILIKRYTPFITKSYLTEEEITNLSSKDNQEDILNALKKLDEKIKTNKEPEVTIKSRVKMEVKTEEKSEAEEERKRKEEEGKKRKEKEKIRSKIEDKNENTEEKPSHKKRNIAFISSGIAAVSVSITLLILALLGFLSFGIGLDIAVGLFVIGTGSTGFGSKSFDNEKIAELMERDPETYTKSEKVLYGWRKPIKERIKNFAQTDRPESENSLSQKEM